MKPKKQITGFAHHEPLPIPRFNQAVVIDDSTADFEITSTILKACYVAREVKTEPDPAAFLNKLHSVERLSDVPELVFINLHMDSLKNLDFISEFESMSDFVKNKCKIVVLTNLCDLNEKFRILQNPAVVRYLIKPLDAFQLREFITH